MKKIMVMFAAVLLHCSDMYTKNIDVYESAIVSPALGSTEITDRVIFAGLVRDNRHKPVKRVKVNLFVDNRKVASVLTDDDGVWSYYLKPNQVLSDGAHSAQAEVEFSALNSELIRGTLFVVDTNRAINRSELRSGNVSVQHSSINFPSEGSRVNDTTPTVVGTLRNNSSQPVANETVYVKMNGSTVGTVVSSSTGVFSYTLTSGQALSETTHTVGAQCVQTNVDLISRNFTVDVTPPAAPVIVSPTQNQVLTSSTVVVTGTTEADSMIVTFMDGDTYGDVSYSDGNGDWSIEYILSNGSHTLQGYAEDPAGNAGPLSGTRNFSVSV